LRINDGDNIGGELDLLWKTTGQDAVLELGVGNDGDRDIAGPRSYWTGLIEMSENKLHE